MAFDIQGALKEGYSLPEIVDYLGGQKKFDVAGARSEGYSDQEILDFLSPKKERRRHRYSTTPWCRTASIYRSNSIRIHHQRR
jgi:hypothetical protein